MALCPPLDGVNPTPQEASQHQANAHTHAAARAPASARTPIATPTASPRTPRNNTQAFWRHQPDHDQQSPTARDQLTRLLARSGTMAEALLGLAPASRLDDAQTNKFPIHHPDQIQEQLRRVIEHKVTPTRAEHISVTFDIRNTVQFTLPDAEGHGEDETPLENLDPALGGGAPPPTATPDVVGTKTVRVNDVLVNQPQDDPSLQRSVAKHIVGLLSAVDGTSWAVRDISRGSQGWTVTHVCKDSLTAWTQQHQKNPDKAAIGDYSLKDPAMAIFERPAFDCRGSLTIAFSKTARVISVKYDHTPLHKTVAQMAEHFRPPPPPVPIAAAAAETPDKTKKKKTPRKSKAAAETPEDGEGGVSSQPKKTPRKRKSNAADGAEGGSGSSTRPRKRTKKSDVGPSAVAPLEDGQSQVHGTQAGANGDTPAQTRADEVVQSSVHSHALLKVPQAEASRRRETAIRLLSEGGVEPETLSTEQFSIFANQSPDLQRESLAMLAKYGAERLRIVHPKDAAASESPSGGSSAEPTPQPSEGPAAVDPSSNSAEAGGVEASPGGKKTPKPKVTRGSCAPCRFSRTKCDRTKPSCAVCIASGIDCEYPLQQSRGQKGDNNDKPATSRKSAARVELELEEEETEEPEPDDIETIDCTSNMPVANMLTPAADTSSHDYFNTGSGGLSFPHISAADQGINPSHMSYPAPPVTTEETYSEPPASTVNSPPKVRQTNGRRSLPSSPASGASSLEQDQAHVHSQTLPNSYGNGWQANASGADSGSADTRSPNLAKPADRHHQQQPSPNTQAAQTYTPSQKSPFQVSKQTAREKSRTGQRSQTPRSGHRSSTPSHHMVQQNQPPVAPAYSAAADLAALSQHHPYSSRYQGTAEDQSAPSRLSYEPYAAQASAAGSASFPLQAGYNKQAPSTSTSMASQVSQQPAASGYTTTAATSNQDWSNSRGHDSQAYGTTTSSSSAPAYASQNSAMSQQQQQSSSVQQFNMRSSSAGQQSRPQQAYGNYSAQAQPQTSARQQAHEQTQPTAQQQQQQNWYGGLGSSSTGYGSRGGGSANYGSGAAGAGSYGHHQHNQHNQHNQHGQQQQHTQQHGSLNMSGHGYGGAEGDIFDLLKAGMNAR